MKYEYDRVYVPEKKYILPKRATIGKVTPSDNSMMQPNETFFKYFPEAEFPKELGHANRSSCLRIGAYYSKRQANDLGYLHTVPKAISTSKRSYEDILAYIQSAK